MGRRKRSEERVEEGRSGSRRRGHGEEREGDKGREGGERSIQLLL